MGSRVATDGVSYGYTTRHTESVEDAAIRRCLDLHQIFGVEHKNVVTDVLAMLVHTPHGESDPASLQRLASRRTYEGVKDATERLWKSGVLRGASGKACYSTLLTRHGRHTVSCAIC